MGGSISSSSAYRKHLTVCQTLIHTHQRNCLKGDRSLGGYDKPLAPGRRDESHMYVCNNTYVNTVCFRLWASRKVETTISLSTVAELISLSPLQAGCTRLFLRGVGVHTVAMLTGFTSFSSMHWFRAVMQGSAPPSSSRLDTPTPTPPAHMCTPNVTAPA